MVRDIPVWIAPNAREPDRQGDRALCKRFLIFEKAQNDGKAGGS